MKHSIMNLVSKLLIALHIVVPFIPSAATAKNSCSNGVEKFAPPPAADRLNYVDLGFYRITAVTPEMKLGSPNLNVAEMVDIAKELSSSDSQIVVFPELSITGYTLQDYFHRDQILQQTKTALIEFLDRTKDYNSVYVVGAPYRTFDGRFYNVAFVISKGKILGAIPKIYLPTYGEFEEARWFDSGKDIDMVVKDSKLGEFRLSSKQLFRVRDLVLGIEICEDGWATQTPGSFHALAGANVIINLSASNDRIGKDGFRRQMINQRAADNLSGYVYVSSGPTESTEDIVFGGHKLISDNGSLLNESDLFVRESNYITGDIDVGKLLHERQVNRTFGSSPRPQGYHLVELPIEPKIAQLKRKIDPHPFVPSDASELARRAKMIIQTAAVGLEERIRRTHSKAMVLGLSGGLDSTLALLICIETANRLGWPMSKIHTFSLPGFGTSTETKESSRALATLVGTTFKEVSIIPMAEAMLRQLEHEHTLTPGAAKDVVYENAQARARTDFLFTHGNKSDVNGILVGTGTLSELCLGHCTFNADQTSSYNPNVSIPKTLVKWLVKWYADNNASEDLKTELLKVYKRKMSAELLPPNPDGTISQITEDFVGPYELHDFFIKAHLRDGFDTYKTFQLARLAFSGTYSDSTYTPSEIKKWLKIFYKRFHTQQFKRDTLPAGPKVGSVSLSPRGDLRLPGDLAPEAIQREVDRIDKYYPE